MASIELSEAMARVTVDLMAAFDLPVEKAAHLYNEVYFGAKYFTESIYKNETRHIEKSVDAVAVTLITLSAQLIISNRKSVKVAVQEAMTAISHAIKHAREVDELLWKQAQAKSA